MRVQYVEAQPQLDITLDKHEDHMYPAQVEIDHNRGTMYVHVNGITVFRLCRSDKGFEVQQHGLDWVKEIEKENKQRINHL